MAKPGIAQPRKVTRRIAEFSIRRIDEACGIEISSTDLAVVVLVDVAAGDDIRINIIDSGIVHIGGDPHGHARGVVKVAADRPSAQ